MTLKEKIQSLLDKINATTGAKDEDLTSAVLRLCEMVEGGD